MDYTFYCEKSGDRFAQMRTYKTRLGLKNRIRKLEAQGYRVDVKKNERCWSKYVYKTGQGFIN